MRRICLAVLTLLAPLLWLFRRVLFTGEAFAFRDAAYYYFPFYKYVQSAWTQGLPLWNPLDGLGQPLLGDPTAAVLYPGKLVFLLPVSFQLSFAIYIVGHLWLAGLGATFLARRCRVNFTGALVAGLAYELSGQVLFQYCNPIFAVGAAWLPWSIGCLIPAITANRNARRHQLLAALAISMMVLGGDPQMAYHVILMAALLVLLLRVGRSRELAPKRGWTAIAAVANIAILLSAVQILPTAEWARQSDRSLRDAPRSLFEWCLDAAMGTANASSQLQPNLQPNLRASRLPALDALWKQDTDSAHAGKVYDFSVGPWRWAELVWPNFSGPLFPENRRWLTALPGEGRMWTPSLYLGLLPLLLALSRMRFRRGSPFVRWWSWLAIGSALAAMGGYGLGWLVNECRFVVDGAGFQRVAAMPGCGGLYWLMNCVLPGYVSFRYPAKLWTITALALSLLAGHGWPLLASRSQLAAKNLHVRARRCLFAVLVLSCVLLLGTLVWQDALVQWAATAPTSPVFGPVQAYRLPFDLSVCFTHALLLTASLLLVMRFARSSKASCLVALVVVDLAVAQAGLIQTLPAALWDVGATSAPARCLYRSDPERCYAPDWAHQSSAMRFVELQTSDAQTWMPKHHLLNGDRALRSMVSMTSADYAAIWKLALQGGHVAKDGTRVPHVDVLSILGTTDLVVQRSDFEAADSLLRVHRQHTAIDQFTNPSHYPRAWLSTNWRVLEPLQDSSEGALLHRTREVLYDQHAVRDLRNEVVVEATGIAPSSPTDVGTTRGDSRVDSRVDSPDAVQEAVQNNSLGACNIVEDSPHIVALEVRTDQPSIVVLNDQYFPGWEVHVQPRGNGRDATQEAADFEQQTCLRTNRVMRGVLIPPGAFRVEFRYRPRSVIWGGTISAVSWLVVLGWLVIGRREV